MFDEAVTDKARALVEAMAEALGGHDEAIYEYDPVSRVEEVETEFRDGFIPYTEGGFMVTLPASIYSAWGSGSAPAPIQALIDANWSDIRDEWDRQNPETPYDSLDHDSPEWDRFGEFESEWWQGDDDCYFWKARVLFYAKGNPRSDTPEHDTVYVDAYLCTDSYGRDSIPWLAPLGGTPNQTVGEFKLNIPAARFAMLSEAGIERLAKAAMRKLP